MYKDDWPMPSSNNLKRLPKFKTNTPPSFSCSTPPATGHTATEPTSGSHLSLSWPAASAALSNGNGLTHRRVAVWFYQDHLHVEYQQTLLARYHYRFDRRATKIANISRPKLYRSLVTSPQLELLELDDTQWLKILRPEYAKRQALMKSAVKQLVFDFYLLFWLFWSR
jgi:hypothetical protein